MENLFDKLLVSSDTDCIPNKEESLFFGGGGFFFPNYYYMTAARHSDGFNGKTLKKQDNLKNLSFSSQKIIFAVQLLTIP